MEICNQCGDPVSDMPANVGGNFLYYHLPNQENIPVHRKCRVSWFIRQFEAMTSRKDRRKFVAETIF